jgi:hypothetical protein
MCIHATESDDFWFVGDFFGHEGGWGEQQVSGVFAGVFTTTCRDFVLSATAFN